MTTEVRPEQTAQMQRIEAALSSLMGATSYRSSYVYSDDGISFRVDGAEGRILCESYRPTSAREIADMSDEQIARRLQEMFAKTGRLLDGF
jgi:hypothetical protein